MQGFFWLWEQDLCTADFLKVTKKCQDIWQDTQICQTETDRTKTKYVMYGHVRRTDCFREVCVQTLYSK